MLLSLLPGGWAPAAQAGDFLDAQRRFRRVAAAVTAHRPALEADFRRAGAAWPPGGVFFRAFKREGILELWAAPPEPKQRWIKVRTVPICKASGKLGPKVKQGDRQVPEGFYEIKRFSPKSPFHLGLWLSYPNKVDWRRAASARKSPGGAIRIHGGCITSGCLPVQDQPMEALYVAAAMARDGGQKSIPVHVFPCRFGDPSCETELGERRAEDARLKEFWKTLATGHDLFVSQGTPPAVEPTRKGYVFKGPTVRPGAPRLAAPPRAIGGDVRPCGTVPADMSCVPGGPFTRGVDNDPYFGKGAKNQAIPLRGGADTVPAARVWLQTFAMDKFEVTYEQFQSCVKSGKCKKAGPRYRDYDGPKQPVTGVSWYDAKSYCETLGRRLPTEAEWEKAARGTDGELTPFGDAVVTCKIAVIKDPKAGRSCGVKKRFGKGSKGKVLPVGSRPPGRYGLYDMVGNAQEWTADWYSRSYGTCGAACLGNNPKGPCGGAAFCKGHWFKVVRGGSWYWQGEHATGFHRRPHWPKNKPYHHFGFRCARDVTP